MSIGLELKQARENKGTSLQEAAVKTKIQAKFLEALESDDFASLPSSLYAKGFLKTYAKYLNLDPNDMASKMEGSGLTTEKQVIVLENKELPPVRRESYFKKIILAAIGICIAAGLILFFISFLRNYHPQPRKKPAVVKIQQKNNKKQQAPVLKKAIVKPAAVKPMPRDVTLKPQPIAAQSAVNIPLNLTVIAKRPCHLSVKADGMLLFEGFLLPGSTDQWQAKKSFELGISDGSAVELVVNGKKLSQAASGQKRDMVITKDGIRRK